MAGRTRGGGKRDTQSNRDNKANQLNRNNDAYWKARRYDERPNDWNKKGGKGKSK